RAAGEDDRLRRDLADLLRRQVAGLDDRIDLLLADAARDELRVLRSEVEYEDGFGHYSRFRSSLPGLKRMVLPGGIFTSTPVFGLRPIPFLRCLTWNTPNPRSSMRWPRARAFRKPSMTVSTACAAFTLEISDTSATF